MPRVLTGNRLETGDVLWWNGSDWSLHLRDAVAIGDEGEALLADLIADVAGVMSNPRLRHPAQGGR